MRPRLTTSLALFVFLSTLETVLGQANLPIYTDRLVNGFQDWSWATRNMANTTPVHGGTASISVTSAAFTALSFQHPDFNTSPYSNISFWAHGGTGGGQRLQVYVQYGPSGTSGSTVVLPTTLTAGTWTQYTISLSSLGVANRANVNRINIQLAGSGTTGTFYVDDIQIGAAPAPALVHLNVNAAQTVRTADARWFGLNTAVWDSNFDSTSTSNALRELGTGLLRFPGGSLSDEYHWATGTTLSNPWTWVTSWANFMHVATNAGVQGMICVNYGTGTSNEAAGWVRSANITNHCNFKYWEIGNECYGSWETDSNAVAHDPYTYAVRAASYIALMKAADPTIKIGVVAVAGEDNYANNTSHPATNPRTGLVHNGWTPVMLTTLKTLGVTPDFLVHHVYPQYTGPESDPLVLQASVNWAIDAADLRQQLTDYVGAGGTGVELLCTENNANSGSQGRQSTSLVNALYLADSLSQLMKTEFNGYVWWDLRNGADTGGSFDPTLYGWRNNGDLGIMLDTTTRYPTFYADKVMRYFVQTNDTILNPTSDYLLLSAYAARKADGKLAVLVINKDSTTNFNGQIVLNGFVPDSTATVRSFGILQDEATRTNSTVPGSQDMATNSFTGASTNFTYSFPRLTLTLFTFSPASNLPATTVGMTSSANPSTYGNTVTFTTTVRTNGVAVGGISGETIAFYNGAVQLGTGALNGSGQAAYTTTANQLAAGSLSITAVYGGDAVYRSSTNFPALSQTVNQATLTPGLTGTVSKTYNGTTTATLVAGNYTLPGVVSGDTVTLNNPTSGTYDNRNQGTGKTVSVTGLAISGSSSANYVLSSTSASATVGTINPATLTYTANPATMSYGSALPVFNGTVTGFVAGENQVNATTGTSTFATTATSSSNVGTYSINGSGLTANNGNYTFVQAPGNAAALTINALAANLTGTRPYDGTTITPAGILSVANKVGSDDVTVASGTGTLASANVGVQPITSFGTLSLGGASAPNYTLLSASGAVNITAAGLTVSVTNLLALDRIYDGTTNVELNTTNAGLDGVLNGDDVTLVSSNAIGYFADKNVGTNKPVTVVGLALNGASATNYSLIDPTNITATITPADLTVSGVTAASKVFDGTTVATLNGTPSLNGQVPTDDLSLVTSNVTASFADPDVGTSKPVTVTGYDIAGTDGGNYLLSQPVGLTADILALVTPAFANQGIAAGAGGWQLSFSGQAGQTYKILGTTDLRLPQSQWTIVTSGTFGSGPVTFTDNSTNLPARFYRIVSP